MLETGFVVMAEFLATVLMPPGNAGPIKHESQGQGNWTKASSDTKVCVGHCSLTGAS